MSLEKTTSISIDTAAGKMSFARVDDELKIKVISHDSVVLDEAVLTESELRSLVKEIFPGTRKPRDPNAVAATNGTRKRGPKPAVHAA